MKNKILALLLTLTMSLTLVACGDVNVVISTDPSNNNGKDASATIVNTDNKASEVVDPDFEVHFIDVGQADSILIISDDETMLIDGGNRDDSDLIYSYLSQQNIEHIDYMVATHAHEDHIGGLPGALEYATVGTVYSPLTDYDSATWRNFEKAVNNRNAELSIPEEGNSFNLGSAEVTVLACNPDKDTNNTSIVLRIDHGENSFIFTGDAEAEVEKEILADGYDVDVDVLKVGHHGSESSSSYQFLKAVTPLYSVISCGVDNSYGHPHEEPLSRLRDVDTKVYRTDMQGTIVCYSDGENISFAVEKNATADTILLPPNSTQKNKETEYILNTNSLKFHSPECKNAQSMSKKNRKDYTGTRESVIEMGYEPCGTCDP